jgi:hypothetical protein
MNNSKALMASTKLKSTTPKLDALRAELQPKAALSLEEQLAGLDDNTLNSVTTTVRMLSMVYDPTEQKSYASHVENIYPKTPVERKRLYVSLMQELMPEQEYTGVEQTKPNYANEFYNRPNMQLRPTKQPSAQEQLSFMDKMVQP